MVFKIVNENNKGMEANETNKGNIVKSFLKKETKYYKKTETKHRIKKLVMKKKHT
jgi:hypothetical protein